MTRRAYDLMASQPWAIKPEWLPLLAAIAERDANATDLLSRELGRSNWNDNRQAIDFRGGTSYGSVSRIRNGIAILPIIGPVFPYANLMQEMSGATSLSVLAKDYEAALLDPAVTSILFEVDSPGGVASGPGEFARSVRGRDRSKPVWVYVSGMAASAAYWIASAADRVIAADESLTGSIGVVLNIHSQELPDRDGFREFELTSSNAANKRPDVTTEEGRAVLTQTLDEIEGVFLRDVATFRGVSVDQVIAGFGQGAIFTGMEALRRGMIDGLGTFESTLADLAGVAAGGQSEPRQPNNQGAAADARQSEDQSMNWDEITAETLTANRPDLAAAISEQAAANVRASIETSNEPAIESARTDAAAAERERILGIEALSMPGHEALIATLKADGTTTPEAAAVQLIQASKKSEVDALQALKGDDHGKDAPKSDPTPSGITTIEESAQHGADPSQTNTEEKARSDYAASETIRSEYRSADAFVVYRQAVEDGRITDPNPL